MLSIAEILSCRNAIGFAELPSIELFVCSLQKCRGTKNLVFAIQLHTYVCNIGLDLHPYVGNYVLRMFLACGSLLASQQAFKRLPCPNVYSWTSLILGFVECEKCEHALRFYHDMKKENVYPNSYTFMALLQACACLKDACAGREIHIEISMLGLEGCVYVGSSLVHMYAKCRLFLEAEQVIKKLPDGNAVSWNALIVGYAEQGQSLKAMECIEQMERDAIHPDIVTFICVLKACGNRGEIHKGHGIHMDLAKQGMETNSIAGYAEHGLFQEALNCFEQFRSWDTRLDATISACVLKLCGRLGAVEKGLVLHNELYTRGIESSLHVGSSLVDMYAKCGRLPEARKVLDKQAYRNTVLWNALLNGYAINEGSDLAVEAFEIMQTEGVKPDAVTFLCLLSACSRTSHVQKGQEYVSTMIDTHGILLSAAHFTCNIDLLARSGRLREAHKLFNSIPHLPSRYMWTSLLSACITYKGERGQSCFDELIQKASVAI